MRNLYNYPILCVHRYDDNWIEYQYKIFIKYIDGNKKIYNYGGSNYSFEEFLHYQDYYRFLNLSNIKIPNYGCFDFWIPFEDFSGFDYYKQVMDGLHRMFYKDNKITRWEKFHSILLNDK